MSVSTDELVDVDIETVVAPYEDIDDGNDHHTHIVNPPSNLHLWTRGMSAQDIVSLARAKGTYVVALCGYEWVPKRNPDKYPACTKCIDMAGALMRGRDE